MRKSGYYWIKMKNTDNWIIGCYHERTKVWTIFNLYRYFNDNDLKEIDEEQIVRKEK